MAKSPLEIWQDGPAAQPYQPPKQDIRDWALWVEGLLDPDATGTGVDFATDLTALDNSLNGHLGNHNNPHQVTKAQIGLGNVDNTADIDKPVSTAQSLAIGVEHDLLACRPGDMPHHFVDVLDGGDPSILQKLALGQEASGDAGFVRRIAGAGIIARRTLFAIEPGKVYSATFVVQRRTNTTDPSNDAARCALAWYNQATAPAATAQTVIQDLLTLTVGSGRTLVTATIARATGEGISVIAPADARYVRPFIQLYGTTSVTDVELIDWGDVTHANGYSPNLDALTGRVGALESIDAGNRITALEAEVSAPNTIRLAMVADLAAMTVPTTVDTVEMQGYHRAGDGGAMMLLRLSALDAIQPGEQTSNGGTVRWGIATGQEIRPEMFGALADYTVGGSGTDSTAAFQKAVDYCDAVGIGELRLRPSQGAAFLITATVTAAALMLVGTFGAKVVFKDMNGLVGFDNTGATSVGKTIGARNVEFIVEGANIASAVKEPKQDDQYLTYYTAYRFEGNYCHGANRDAAKYSFAWD